MCGEHMDIVHDTSPGKSDLIAAVERSQGIVIMRHFRDGWHNDKTLPPQARALRFSPDGSTVAWVQDEQRGATVPVGYYQGPQDEKPKLLGPLGIRLHASMGLAVDAGGRVLYLDNVGRIMGTTGGVLALGSEIHITDHGEYAYLDQKGCLVAPEFQLAGKPCGDAIRPVDYIEGRLIVRDNKGIIEYTKGDSFRYAIAEVVDARIRKHGEIAAIRRVNDKNNVYESVVVMRPGGLAVQEVLRAPVVISAELDDDGSVLIIRANHRKSAYDAMLAHAPDEFEGETLSGDAIRITPHFKEVPVPGLEYEKVRALFRGR